MPYVYFIGDHAGAGIDNTMATLDREHIPAMVRAWLDKYEPNRDPSLMTEKLARLLEGEDEGLINGGNRLGDGWGALLLYVVKLEP